MSTNERPEGDYSLTEPESAPAGEGASAHVKRDTKTVGESAGGILGASSGMAVGAIAGPVGLVVGGLAGALGGWWAGKGIANAVSNDDDAAYRRDFETRADRPADGRYED